jgi:hypothetical protein
LYYLLIAKETKGSWLLLSCCLPDLLFILKMEAVRSSEASVNPYQTTRSQIKEGSIFYIHNLKCNKKNIFWFSVHIFRIVTSRLSMSDGVNIGIPFWS